MTLSGVGSEAGSRGNGGDQTLPTEPLTRAGQRRAVGARTRGRLRALRCCRRPRAADAGAGVGRGKGGRSLSPSPQAERLRSTILY